MTTDKNTPTLEGHLSIARSDYLFNALDDLIFYNQWSIVRYNLKRIEDERIKPEVMNSKTPHISACNLIAE